MSTYSLVEPKLDWSCRYLTNQDYISLCLFLTPPQFDVNGNGQLEFSEFVALMLSLNSTTANAKVAEFFEKIDVNGDKMLR